MGSSILDLFIEDINDSTTLYYIHHGIRTVHLNIIRWVMFQTVMVLLIIIEEGGMNLVEDAWGSHF